MANFCQEFLKRLGFLHASFLLTELGTVTFGSLKPEAKTEPLQPVVSYIEENWIRICIYY